MAYLPLENKPLIQSSYVRFRELAKEIPTVDKKVTTARVTQWGGLVVAVLFLGRAMILGGGVAGFVGGVGLLAFFVGWVYKHDESKKQMALWEERRAIWKQMKEIGVQFSDALDRITVYAGSIATENEVSPLHDGAYR